MALLSFHEYRTMPYPDRCRRIGELVAKAAIRYFQQQLLARTMRRMEPADATAQVDLTMMVADETEKQIVRFVGCTGTATPHDVHKALGLNRRTVSRKLARLRSAGILIAHGKTNSNRYELRGLGGEN